MKTPQCGSPIGCIEANQLIKFQKDINGFLPNSSIEQLVKQSSHIVSKTSDDDIPVDASTAIEYFNNGNNAFIFDRYLVERFFHDPAYAEMRYLVVIKAANKFSVSDSDAQVCKPTTIMAACKDISDHSNDLTTKTLIGKKLEVLGSGDIALNEHPPGEVVVEIHDGQEVIDSHTHKVIDDAKADNANIESKEITTKEVHRKKKGRMTITINSI